MQFNTWMRFLVLFIAHFHKVLLWHLLEIGHGQGQPKAVEEIFVNQHPQAHTQPAANTVLSLFTGLI